MKSIFLFGLSILFCIASQAQDVNTLHDTARSFMRSGDLDNALIVLNKAVQLAPNDVSLLKDKEYVYYLQKDYGSAIATGNTILLKPSADAEAYQVLGLSYRAIAEYKEGDKMYSEALKKFPSSGELYNDYGEMQIEERLPGGAIKSWEKGIEMDPNYGSNYYNAAKFYDISGNTLWSMLYSEIFINIESLTARTVEMKNLLLNDYKKAFASSYFNDVIIKGTPFEKAVATIFNANKDSFTLGITTESLIALRTKFILTWGTQYASQYPFKLFDFQKQLLQQGNFTAYNQWIFGQVSNSAAYGDWLDGHANEMQSFKHFQGNVLFKTPAGQYYPH